MSERKFSRALQRPGSAAQVREIVSQAVRQSTIAATPDKPMSLSESERLAANMSEKVQAAMMANSARRDVEDDHEMRVDLQHQLAESYTRSAPSLRKNWLESMAKIHIKNGDLSEASCCLLHIAALQAEVLRSKNAHRIPIRSYQRQIKTWIEAFDRTSPNVTRDEFGHSLYSNNVNGGAGNRSAMFSPTSPIAPPNNDNSDSSLKEESEDSDTNHSANGSNGNLTQSNNSSNQSSVNSLQQLQNLQISNMNSTQHHQQQSHHHNKPSQEELQFSEGSLVHVLESAAEYVMRAERYELIPTIMSIVIPTYEMQRNYEALAYAYRMCHESCLKAIEVNRSGKRFLGSYFRVKFFGRQYFDEDSGREYVYKEPKVTSLAEISTRLKSLYSRKFGAENVELIMDSKEIDPERELDSSKAAIQITFVTPYHGQEDNDREPDDLRRRVNYFEKNHNINRFSYETPFTMSGKARSSRPEEQYKRRTILTTQSFFPYVKKRILVVDRQTKVLSPIEVAIDEMSIRCDELRDVIYAPRDPAVPFDLKKLQLKLQGSISVQVNAGPVAYLKAFLEPSSKSASNGSSKSGSNNGSGSNSSKYSPYHVDKLKRTFKEFILLCDEGLKINKQLIASDQQEYHVAMMRNYALLAQQIQLLDADPSDDPTQLKRASVQFFDRISSSSTKFYAPPPPHMMNIHANPQPPPHNGHKSMPPNGNGTSK